jgi:hypothetical protein
VTVILRPPAALPQDRPKRCRHRGRQRNLKRLIAAHFAALRIAKRCIRTWPIVCFFVRRAGGPFTDALAARALILIPGQPRKASHAPIVRITRTNRKAKQMPLQAPLDVSSERRIMATSMRSITLT